MRAIRDGVPPPMRRHGKTNSLFAEAERCIAEIRLQYVYDYLKFMDDFAKVFHPSVSE